MDLKIGEQYGHIASQNGSVDPILFYTCECPGGEKIFQKPLDKLNKTWYNINGKRGKNMKQMIWFDMDGTIADLYGVEGWLEDIKDERTDAYRDAKPMLNLQALARVLNRLEKAGYEIGVVSWLAKGARADYDEKVRETKKTWLAEHLASVKFARVDIIKYGEPKQNGRDGILFDDEEPNRKAWNGQAYDVNEIINVLRAM